MNWLKTTRQLRRRTQQEVADLVGITLRYYQYIEKGEQKPHINVAKKIGEVLGFDWALIFKDDPKPPKTEIVEGLTAKQLSHFTDQLEMNKAVKSYEFEKTGDNEYKVIIQRGEDNENV